MAQKRPEDMTLQEMIDAGLVIPTGKFEVEQKKPEDMTLQEMIDAGLVIPPNKEDRSRIGEHVSPPPNVVNPPRPGDFNIRGRGSQAPPKTESEVKQEVLTNPLDPNQQIGGDESDNPLSSYIPKGFQDLWHAVNEPIAPIGKDNVLEQATASLAKDHPALVGGMNFLTDALSGLSSPVNLATMGTGAATQAASRLGYRPLAKALDYGTRALSAPVFGGGVEDVYKGYQEGNYGRMATGGLEMLGGGLGMRSGLPDPMMNPKEQITTPPDTTTPVTPEQVLTEANQGNVAGAPVAGTVPNQPRFTPGKNQRQVKAYQKLTKAFQNPAIPLERQLTENEIKELGNLVNASDHIDNIYDKGIAITGIAKLLQGKRLSPNQIRLLKDVFGPDFEEKAGTFVKQYDRLHGGRTKQLFQELFSANRAILASLDLSAPLRQGAAFAGRKEWWDSLWEMFGSMSEEGFKDAVNAIHSDPSFPLAESSGLSFSSIGELSTREEVFLSKLSNLPGIRHSSRAYEAFLNKLRMDTFKRMQKDYMNVGIDLSKDKETAMKVADFINNGTGRGSLKAFGKDFEDLNGILSNALFSPRFQVSRVKMYNDVFNPYHYIFEKDKVMRDARLRSLVSLGSLYMTTATLAHMAGAKINLDPTSSDFLKFRKGNFRMDQSAGLQSWAVLAARLLAQQTTSPDPVAKTTEYGNKANTSFADTAEDFFTNKLNTPWKFAYDVMRRSSSRPFDLSTEATEAFIPLFLQDLNQLRKQDPALIPVFGVPLLFGAGSNYFEPKPRR